MVLGLVVCNNNLWWLVHSTYFKFLLVSFCECTVLWVVTFYDLSLHTTTAVFIANTRNGVRRVCVFLCGYTSFVELSESIKEKLTWVKVKSPSSLCCCCNVAITLLSFPVVRRHECVVLWISWTLVRVFLFPRVVVTLPLPLQFRVVCNIHPLQTIIKKVKFIG